MDLEGGCRGRIYYQVCAALKFPNHNKKKIWWGFIVLITGTPRYESSNNAIN
jgi:hypothetical protein